MPTPLDATNIEILQEHADAGDRIAYRVGAANKLAKKGARDPDPIVVQTNGSYSRCRAAR